MIDTNIFLDVFLRRKPFFDASKAALKLCEDGKVSGFIPASVITDIFYLSHRFFHNNNDAYKVIGHVIDIVKILPVTNDDVLKAYIQRAADFEDCLLVTCAKSNQCHGIATRNKRDFTDFGIKLFSPEELLKLF